MLSSMNSYPSGIWIQLVHWVLLQGRHLYVNEAIDPPFVAILLLNGIVSAVLVVMSFVVRVNGSVKSTPGICSYPFTTNLALKIVSCPHFSFIPITHLDLSIFCLSAGATDLGTTFKICLFLNFVSSLIIPLTHFFVSFPFTASSKLLGIMLGCLPASAAEKTYCTTWGMCCSSLFFFFHNIGGCIR